jgi:hypothetical protein
MSTTKGTKGLGRLYEALSADERFPAMLSAAARRDDVELGRLMSTAPRVVLQVPETFGRAVGLLLTHYQHRVGQLAIAATFNRLVGLVEAMDAIGERGGRGYAKIAGAVRLYSYLVRVNAEGWELFCERQGFPRGFFDERLQGDHVLRQAAETAGSPGLGFDEAAARDYLRQAGDSPDELSTAETVAADLAEAFAYARGLMGD